MAELPHISDAEWRVMKVLWQMSPLSADEIVAAVEATEIWQPRTVKTLLNRLLKKGALGFQKEGRKFRYFPLAGEHEHVREETRSFLQRVYDGAITPMLASFLKEESLSPEEIAELRELLSKKPEKRK